jgi:hypothetical protein
MMRLLRFMPRLTLGLCMLGGFSCLVPELLPAQPVAIVAAPAYEDQYIDGGTLAPDIVRGEDGASDSHGLARSIRIDSIATLLSSDEAGVTHNVVENGVVLKSQWETATYGAWSLDAALRTGTSGSATSSAGQSGVVSLRQRAMPFDGGWQADNALGDLNSPNINLARSQPRFYLPTGPMRGATTEWRGPNGTQLVAGTGSPSVYSGIEVPGFHALGGRVADVGAQYSPTPGWTVGGQFIQANDVRLAIGTATSGEPLLSSSTGLLTAAWQEQGKRAQMNLISGAISGKSSAIGGWFDATIARGRLLNNFGVFHIDPNMTWGNQLITSDAQGGYYRLGYQSRQWLSDVGVDAVRSITGAGGNSVFLTGDTRYQISRDWGVGTVGNTSHNTGGTGWSLQAFVDHLNRLGTGRVQAGFARNPTGNDATLALDQTWSVPAGYRLSTSAVLERISSMSVYNVQQDGTALSIAAFGGGQLTSRLSIEGYAHWSTALQGTSAPAMSANISVIWQANRNWSILASLYNSQISSWNSLIITSPLTPPINTSIPATRQQGAFLTFRYQQASGMHFAPLGGGAGAGSGRLSGSVYLDANSNGQQDAAETGPPNITVVLDGRYSTQTDVNGRFDFPAVATGRHVITVIADNLPLPWVFTSDKSIEVDVTTRDRTDIGIAAIRPR